MPSTTVSTRHSGFTWMESWVDLSRIRRWKSGYHTNNMRRLIGNKNDEVRSRKAVPKNSFRRAIDNRCRSQSSQRNRDQRCWNGQGWTRPSCCIWTGTCLTIETNHLRFRLTKALNENVHRVREFSIYVASWISTTFKAYTAVNDFLSPIWGYGEILRS